MNNNITKELSRVILWQYDNATNLVAFIDYLKTIFTDTTAKFWDNMYANFNNIETANAFGLGIWGIILGVERPKGTINNSEWVASTEEYRNIIRAKFKLYHSDMSMKDLQEYADTIFGTVGIGGDSKVLITENVDSNDQATMAITYSFQGSVSAKEEIILDFPGIKEYPAAVRSDMRIDEIVFGFAGQETTNLPHVIIGNLGSSDNSMSSSFANYSTNGNRFD